MRAGRLVAVAAAGILALSGLAACQAKPTVAAYVDDIVITEAEVDTVIDEVRDSLERAAESRLAQHEQRLTEAGKLGETELATEVENARRQEFEWRHQQLTVTRDRVVQMRILTEAASRYAQQQGVSVPEPDPQELAEQIALPTDHPYVAVVAEYFAVMTPLQNTVEPAEPTEADQRAIYDNLVASEQTTVPFAEAQQTLTKDTVGEAVAVRNLFRAILAEVKVRVSPHYEAVYQVPVEFPGGETWLDVPLGEPASDM